MTQTELIRRLVLNEICDDYEEINRITEHVSREGAKCGLTIDQIGVWQALSDLVASGLVKAWRLYPSHQPLEGMPSPREMEGPHDCYFYATQDGLNLQLGDDGWYPFDDDGNLRKDWTPPAA